MRTEVMSALVGALRIPVQQSHEIGGISNQIFLALEGDDDLYLDALDYILHMTRGKRSGTLKEILESGGSAWTVNSQGVGLEKRVSAAAKNAMDSATASSDTFSKEIQEAWEQAFGRTPDPSDAWDHAIKAVEEVLIPIVLPKVPKPNLGGVAGELEASSTKWHLELASSVNNDSVDTLSRMLRLIWPNPDRHGGGLARRTPSQSEAESAVHLAIAIIEICRNGRLTKN
ncbi:hypothetical protein [Arthrobacter silviterrae]|uniref:Abortive infection family protein n=2 Tax=Arthrobacter silviterrae TaxID=2026658 RepID=A0ABX0DE26_9MICC|nr:hypothetical protein [Arthrobacter silviterrae]NGN85181.1 hypothetical protein [Arthrobacter silviterrae]